MIYQADHRTQQARSRLTQIFRYIQAFNHLQNPPPKDIEKQEWKLWLYTLPYHNCIQHGISVHAENTATLQVPHRPDYDKNKQAIESNDDDFILKVKRPKLTAPPAPPSGIAPWLLNGWQQLDGKVIIDPKHVAKLNSDMKMIQIFKQWTASRDQWVKTETPAYQTLQIFEDLYTLHTRFEREGERIEFMLGDGLLDWDPLSNKNGLYHPVLLLNVQLRFNPQIPEFIISSSEKPPELYTVPLQEISDVNTVNIGRIRQEFEQNSVHPLGGDETVQFLQQFVYQLSSRGEFSAKPSARAYKNFPLISRNPVLFIRNRTFSYNIALEAILEDLPRRTDLPYALLSLTGMNTTDNRQGNDGALPSLLSSPNGEDERILFSKPANFEQLEVARRLEQYGAVRVQGPPGTGKTHTIANLLGHLLAQGKSVLVTSHTPKALKVVREKVVEPLQPLCVSVLGDNNKKDMERAVDAIVERLSSSNRLLLEREVADRTRQRVELITALRQQRQRLKEACSIEYRAIVLDGKSYDPSEAARYVTKNRVSHDWIPTPIVPDTPLLLSLEDLIELYRTNISVSIHDEREMAVGLPNPQQLTAPVDFEQWIIERNDLLHNDREFQRNKWISQPQNSSIQDIQHLHHRLLQAMEPLKQTGNDRRWRLAVIAAGRDGGPRRIIWDDLISEIERVDQLASQAQHLLLKYDPCLPEMYITAQTKHVLTEIVDFFQRNKRLSNMTFLLHRDWKPVIEQARIKGQHPQLETKEHFTALLAYVQLVLEREDLAGRWQRQMAVLGAPNAADMGREIERYCLQYIYPLRQCLNWFDETWSPLEQELKRNGLQWAIVLVEMPVNLSEHGDLLRLCDAVQEKLPPILAAETHRRLYQSNESHFHTLRRTLERSGSTTRDAEVVQRLRIAVDRYDVQAYREAFERLVSLYERQSELRQRHVLLAKLRQCAPGWANAIANREGIHGRRELLDDAQEAWHWRRLNDILDQRSKISLDDLQQQSVRLDTELQRITAVLVEKKTWAALAKRTTQEQKNNLLGWKETMRKIGKGTGVRVPKLRVQAREQMRQCQTAVPVWIMPLSQVVESFDPRHNRFDVVIIDEASQADIKALAAIYMGKQIVVVGDDEQVTPMDVGQKLERVDKLIEEHLQGIPSARNYDGRLSIYDLAKTFELVCLQEHFRCVAPIIQFSNVLSYDGKIKPLRDDSDVQRRPATIAYAVAGASETVNHVNGKEAQTLVSLLVAAMQQPEYHDATFGVISMVGDKQSLYIDELLRRYLSVTEYAQHQILCGNPSQFQGDERDVIFLSMVDIPRGDGPLTLKSEDAYEYRDKKRFNVAASRARDQLWVVHSLDPNIDLKEGDIRKRLILHARNPEYAMSKLAEQEKKVESEFEKQVLKRLVQAGYHVVSQWPIGAYRIDLVVEGAGKRLAVECDGDRWHGIEKLEEDMARQMILERLGWRFTRIGGSHFFRNPDQALAPVFARLRELEIPPMTSTSERAIVADEKLLRDRIERRATELREEWSRKGKQAST